MHIAVDFDDTLMDTHNVPKGYRMGAPNEGALSVITRLVDEGNQITIFTARNVQDPRAYKAVEDWLKYFKIPYHGITNIKKPEFDLYIDDKALHFTNWQQVYADIKTGNSHTDIGQPSNWIEDITKPLS